MKNATARLILRNTRKTAAMLSAPPKEQAIFFFDWWRAAAAFALLAAASAAVLFGQDYQHVAPNLPAQTGASAFVPPPAPNSARAGSQTPLIPALKGLVFLPAVDRFIAAGVSFTGPDAIDLSQVPALDDPHFRAMLAPTLGQPVSLASLDRLKIQTTTWLRAHQQPFVDVSIPPQNIDSGVIQVLVVAYKLNRIQVQGARYFSPAFIRQTSGLTPGQNLRLDALQKDLDRLNRNPFLNVDAVFKPGEQTGETDLTLTAHDRFPLRLYAGYDNLGVRSLGVPETNFGVNWGNVFGSGQILSYQLTRSLSGRYSSHSISDTVSLPWGDQLLIFGSYGVQQPLTAKIFNDLGHSGQASVRYVHNLPRFRRIVQDLQGGYDFKTTDNNLEFAGFQIFAREAEVDQFPLTYEASLSDHAGQTAIQNVFVFSPGGISPNNNTAALSTLVPGSRAHYIYNRFLVTRTTLLPKGFSTVSRITVQASQGNLPYSEQIGGGGVGSVRGYYTDTALGSAGQMFSQELRFPAFSFARLLDRSAPATAAGPGKTQFGIFYDYAALHQVTPIPDVQDKVDLASTGFLARYSLSRYVDVQYDMGVRLRKVPTVPTLGVYGQVSLTGSW